MIFTIYVLCNACWLVKGPNNMIRGLAWIRTCCLANPRPPSESGDIREKRKQFEDNEDPETLMC
jgi:hypothetical protein